MKSPEQRLQRKERGPNPRADTIRSPPSRISDAEMFPFTATPIDPVIRSDSSKLKSVTSAVLKRSRSEVQYVARPFLACFTSKL
jgi:hypothetical protein